MKLVPVSPNQNVIDYIKALHERAESGEIQSIACALTLSGRKTASGWAEVPQLSTSLIGELLVLQRDLMDAIMKLRVDPETGEVEE